MNLQAKFTETRNALVSAVRAISQLEISLKKEQARSKRYVWALEYIEMTGANYGHDGLRKDAPCSCGQCMANTATQALAPDGATEGTK